MFTGPPLPLSLDIPIQQLLAVSHAQPGMGVWVRNGPRELRLRLTGRCRRSRILISSDLGMLLRRCRHIALREGTEMRVLEARVLIRWRALQVVTGIPFLPQPEMLREIYPDAYVCTGGFEVPLDSRAPEEVLGECVSHGIPVAESRIVYRAGG
jgi:hypothetical protein